MSDCLHINRANPTPGKYLPVCLDCGARIIECDGCNATMTAGPHVVGSGWMSQGQKENGVILESTYCPACWSRR